ncbi:hypothetical protein D924_01756 [Enterococcus faecalis 06-MB-S-10]|nr:hypothetical protein D927_00740 [Enterococcus faecalis 02-MB-BW-10]EPH84180.1 hypothetical protein D924_01756 [Enterococcus faecalis 06-MB-S-10]EPH88564.1 hypothetical protein D923_02023 [Enterococcus faecalis 06-MB-S-04]
MKYGLSNDTLVLACHQKFLEIVIEGISPKQKGRPSMSKKKKPVQVSGTSSHKKAPRFRNEYPGTTQERNA